MSVGIVDQTGLDRLSSSKKLTRSITRIVSPGTLITDTQNENSFILSIHELNGDLALAWADITTGEFFISKTIDLYDSLLKIAPREVLIESILKDSRPDLYMESYRASTFLGFKLTENEVNTLTDKLSKPYFQKFILSSKESYQFNSNQVNAGSHILSYIAKMFPLLDHATHFQLPTIFNKETMLLDGTVLNTLEFTRTMDGTKISTLFKSLDKTLTAAGSRLLLSRLSKYFFY